MPKSDSQTTPCPSKDPAGVGYQAFLAGAPYSSSPYGDDDENNAHWRFGWRRACKDRKVPSDEMDSLWCTLNGTAAAEEIERLRVDLMNVRERLRLAVDEISELRSRSAETHG